jgi:TPR repeat protein
MNLGAYVSLNIETIQTQINHLQAQQLKSLGNKQLSQLPEKEQLAFYRRNKTLCELNYKAFLACEKEKSYVDAALYFDAALSLCHQKAIDIVKERDSTKKGVTLTKDELYLPESKLYLLGLCYRYGIGKPRNYDNAFVLMEKAAEQGNAKAKYNLGWMYEKGQGVKQDKALAFEWYRKAAEQGHAKAQCDLGWMYQFGEGVKQDNELAVKWYRKAAEQGYAKAQNDLGWMYQEGEGVEQDKAHAVKWYRQAAVQGYPIAQFNLGWMYQRGEGVEQDKELAVKWYRKAAEQGHAKAQDYLGCKYIGGEGVKKSMKLAARWFRLAAEQGNIHAIGCLYIFTNSFMRYHAAVLETDVKQIKKLIHEDPILIKELIHDLTRVNENSPLYNLMTSLIEPVLTSKPWPKKKALMRKLQFSYLKAVYKNIAVDTILHEQYITKVTNQLSELNIQGLEPSQIKEILQLVSDFYFLIKDRASIGTYLAYKQVALIAIKRCFYQLNLNQAPLTDNEDDKHLLRQCASILIKALFGEEYEINFTATPSFNQLMGMLALYQANPGITPAQINGILAVNLVKPKKFKDSVEFIKVFKAYLNLKTMHNKETPMTQLKVRLTDLLNKIDKLTQNNAQKILDELQAYAKDVLKKSALNPNGFFKVKGNDKELLECVSNYQYNFLLKYFNEVSAKHDDRIQKNNSLQNMSR